MLMDNIESTWHQAATTKNVDLAMSLFAEDAVFTSRTARPIRAKTRYGGFGNTATFQPPANLSATPRLTVSNTISKATRGTLLRVPLRRQRDEENRLPPGHKRRSGAPEWPLADRDAKATPLPQLEIGTRVTRLRWCDLMLLLTAPLIWGVRSLEATVKIGEQRLRRQPSPLMCPASRWRKERWT